MTEVRRILVFVGVLIIGILGVLLWWESGKRPVDANNKSQKTFVIEQGEDVRVIVNNLKKENLIRDPVLFFIYIKTKGFDKKIQAGEYRFSPSMNIEEVADSLLHGKTDIKVLITEGLRGEEIAQILSKNFASYQDSWRQELINNEGYLFPDTYFFPKNADIRIIVSIMKNNFYEKIREINLNEDTKNLPEIVTIASLIEREAKNPEDKPLAASVIYNRLQDGLPLQIDATVQYALAFQDNTGKWWKKDLTEGDLKIDSEYNTYKVVGLPPAPISNPGLISLKAAAFPVKSDYYYYVSDSGGVSHFAKTLAEHKQNIVKYLNK